jgi:hypothetical protein
MLSLPSLTSGFTHPSSVDSTTEPLVRIPDCLKQLGRDHMNIPIYRDAFVLSYKHKELTTSLNITNEPLVRIELTTSSLPRKCSTTELQRHTTAVAGSKSAGDEASRLVGTTIALRLSRISISTEDFSHTWSGRRGSNSPPIAWKAIALPNELLPQSIWRFGNVMIWKLHLKIS